MFRAACQLAGISVWLVMLGVSAAAQTTPRMVVRDTAATDRAARWIDAAVQHAPGVSDRGVDEVAGLTSGDMTGLRVEIQVIRQLMRDPRGRTFVMPGPQPGIPPQLVYGREQIDALVKAAAGAVAAGLDDEDVIARGILLHTDAALLDARAGTILQFTDGQELRLQRGGDHWALARDLASMLDRRSSRQADVQAWYRATLASLADADIWNAAHADAAAARFADDPDLLVLAGGHHESLASARVQASVADARLPQNLTLRVGSASEELRLAAELFKRAVDRAPRHAAGLLHHGRVLTLLGRSGDAVAHLTRAAAGAAEPAQRYYAALFLGAALEAANRRSEARAAYETAAAFYPRAQSPRLALSQLSVRDGNPAEGVRALEPFVSLPPDDPDRHDPWWTYARSIGVDAPRLMGDVRQRLHALQRQTASR
jgi:tetratricopeptide (TPR) repeat protein